MIKTFLRAVLTLLLVMPGYSIAEDTPPHVVPLPDTHISFLETKLRIDNAIAPQDIDAAREVKKIAQIVRSMAGEGATSAQKLTSLKKYLYESGQWNDFRPYEYDQSDPLGRTLRNQLLSTYLSTHRGNCVTMPLLMLFVGQEIGLKMTLAEAPSHILIKYTDDDGRTWNLEATSGGGFTRDVWYRQKLSMSDAAVANGVYLRALNHDEAVALISSTLLEYKMEQKAYEEAITIADDLLRLHPRFVFALVMKGSAYAALLHRETAGRYTQMDQISKPDRIKFDTWYRQNEEAFAKAEAFGWTPDDGK
ncbi:transglutaminase family protein [Allorhizobium undicola]|uniref:transglutaminase family protein n=1 Tax=Allorhizobium undicola TaxID=78527 RepID=UPI0005658D68|nr:transglutaminase family protein [Allorhizobium undicola]